MNRPAAKTIMTNSKIKVELWAADRVIASESNPRVHSAEQVEQIAGSIREFGFTNPILIGPDGRIIAGEGRYRAALILGLEKVPVIVLTHLSDAQRRALAIVDNQLTLNAHWDEEKLREQLTSLENDSFDLSLLGFDDTELAQLLTGQGDAGTTEEDDVPALPIDPVTRPLDLWIMKSAKCCHRLLCGDATSQPGTVRLFDGQQAPVLMITDPPYGVSLEPEWRETAGLNRRTRQGGKILNDRCIDWSAAWTLFPGDVAYVWHAGIRAAAVANELERCEFEIRAQIIWVKQHFAISRGAYHWQHEPCWYAVRKGRNANWRGDRKQTTVWEVANLNPFGGDADEENAASGHSTQKPVELMRRPILNHTRSGDACYDPFLGSGTTLIAAESIGRNCYGVEIDPRYVDVAVKRWQQLTGKQAVLDGDGQTFEQVARARRRHVA
jgi:DNA modification methylase